MAATNSSDVSSLNPPAFSPAAFVHIFTQHPTIKITPTYFPEGSKRWIDDYLLNPDTVIKDLRALGSVDSLMTMSFDEARKWYSKYNMPPPLNSGDKSLYLGSVFDFMMDWQKDPRKFERDSISYLRFKGNSLEFKSSFKDRGAYLPTSVGTYAWVCMPDDPLNNAVDLMNFVNTVEQHELKARQSTDLDHDHDFSLEVPAFAVRSDRSNDPAINGIAGELMPSQLPFTIVDTKYSNRIVFNDKGAYMRSVMTTCNIMAGPRMTYKPRKHVVIDRPFVFVAGGKNSGPLFAIYVPKIYWEYIGGTNLQALESLNAAPWNAYLPASLNPNAPKIPETTGRFPSLSPLKDAPSSPDTTSRSSEYQQLPQEFEQRKLSNLATFEKYKAMFHRNPSINPETNRRIKTGGPTYKRLVMRYGPPPLI
jgi:hypothetical protein